MDIKVAIFEDNRSLRNSLVQLINHEEGMICTGEFADANTVVRSMQLANPDVVIMDIKMPGLSGIEAVGPIKSRYPAVHIIIQTVFEDNDKIFAAICAGASGYLIKKTAPRNIIEAIKETLLGGAPMTGSVAVLVLQMLRQSSTSDKHEFIALSEREQEILALLVKGKTYKMIASECFISVATVSTHVAHIYDKLQVHSKSEAVSKAIKQKLV
ncbi:response regulator [Paraflavitalea pollutisoli]|uniref:response regulator n=1 Tax=Paraflavitalea pollutisoli TaxID=3034143 RepID=UPI0023EE141C|nr:response regulator transcription factor [Paraflavitalea sp. H1-2-19X]